MIFNLFKAKPTLRELIPEGFVDIHSHILPGIDDGAKDINESKELIEEMQGIGFSKIIGTPHTYPGLYDNTEDSIKSAFKKVENLEIKDIELDYGTEYMLEKSIISKSRDKNLLCFKDNYVLIEMSFISEPIGLADIIFEIKVNGFIPVLAHPERYLFIDKKKYFELKKRGCLFQANLLFMTEYYGVIIRKKLDKLIDYGLIDFVGSDIHNLNHIKAFENKVKCKKIDEIEKIIQNNFRFK